LFVLSQQYSEGPQKGHETPLFKNLMDAELADA